MTMTAPDTITCCTCQEPKPAGDYHPSMLRRHYYRCKACHRAALIRTGSRNDLLVRRAAELEPWPAESLRLERRTLDMLRDYLPAGEWEARYQRLLDAELRSQMDRLEMTPLQRWPVLRLTERVS